MKDHTINFATGVTILSGRGGIKDTRLKAKAQKKFQAKDRPSRSQGQGPKTQMQVFSKKKDLQNFFSGEKGLQNFFSGDLYLRKPKKRSLLIFRKVSGVFQRNFDGSNIVLSSSNFRGQGNFRGLEASRPKKSSRTPPLLSGATGKQEEQDCLFYVNYHTAFS